MNTMTNAPVPNYALRRTVALTIFFLFIYFVGLPVFEFVMHAIGYGILAFHDLLVNLGVMESRR